MKITKRKFYPYKKGESYFKVGIEWYNNRNGAVILLNLSRWGISFNFQKAEKEGDGK